MSDNNTGNLWTNELIKNVERKRQAIKGYSIDLKTAINEMNLAQQAWGKKFKDKNLERQYNDAKDKVETIKGKLLVTQKELDALAEQCLAYPVTSQVMQQKLEERMQEKSKKSVELDAEKAKATKKITTLTESKGKIEKLRQIVSDPKNKSVVKDIEDFIEFKRLVKSAREKIEKNRGKKPNNQVSLTKQETDALTDEVYQTEDKLKNINKKLSKKGLKLSSKDMDLLLNTSVPYKHNSSNIDMESFMNNCMISIDGEMKNATDNLERYTKASDVFNMTKSFIDTVKVDDNHAENTSSTTGAGAGTNLPDPVETGIKGWFKKAVNSVKNKIQEIKTRRPRDDENDNSDSGTTTTDTPDLDTKRRAFINSLPKDDDTIEYLANRLYGSFERNAIKVNKDKGDSSSR